MELTSHHFPPFNRNSNFFWPNIVAAFINSTSRSSGTCVLAVVLRSKFRPQLILWVDNIEQFENLHSYTCMMSFSKFPPSLCAPTLPPNLSEELNVAALVPMDALLFQLLPLRPFAEIVLQQNLREFEVWPHFALFSIRRVDGGLPVFLLWWRHVYNLSQ